MTPQELMHAYAEQGVDNCKLKAEIEVLREELKKYETTKEEEKPLLKEVDKGIINPG